MRQTLREPVVFSESVELPQVFSHPHLYLPFAGPGLVLGGAAAAVLLATVLLLEEPALWAPRPGGALAALLLIAAGFWLLLRNPLLREAASLLRRLAPQGEPFADAAALGPFAMMLTHALIARAERPARRQALAPRPAIRCGRGGAAPVVPVPRASFFHAGRVDPALGGG